MCGCLNMNGASQVVLVVRNCLPMWETKRQMELTWEKLFVSWWPRLKLRKGRAWNSLGWWGHLRWQDVLYIPVLYSGALLLIHSVYNSLHPLTQTFTPAPPQSPPPWQPKVWSPCPWVCFCLVKVKALVSQLYPTLCNPMNCIAHQAPLPWDFPGKNTGVVGHFREIRLCRILYSTYKGNCMVFVFLPSLWGHNEKVASTRLCTRTSQTDHMDHSLVWPNGTTSHAVWGHPRWAGHGEEFWQNVAHWRREWQTTSVFLPRGPQEQY